jgi:plastocyanin
MRLSQTLACLTATVAAMSAPYAQPRPADRPVTQADLERLEQKLEQRIEAQQHLIEKLLQLNEQYLRQILALAAELKPTPVAGDARPVVAQPAPRDEPKPPDTRGAVKPKPPQRLGTLVGKISGAGGEGVVYIDDVAGTSRGVATMSQQSKQFSPHTLVVARGTRVEFPNRDAIFHNVFSVTPDNSFDLGSYRQGASRSVTMTKTGVITVYCNLHPQMIGYILVAPSALYAQAAADGSFRLPNVPVGHHRVVAWAPNAKLVTADVDVSDAEPVTVNLAVVRGDPGPHTNKDGMAYGSYKE